MEDLLEPRIGLYLFKKMALEIDQQQFLYYWQSVERRLEKNSNFAFIEISNHFWPGNTTSSRKGIL